ncbi:MAG: amino acid adenylation domain-containing protein, partial [Gordonia polyisoprenivorans]|nr:amino acid adenylation domain-containing protein [Gordonia polyisoprenivorans]
AQRVGGLASVITVDALDPIDTATPPVSDSERLGSLRADNAAYTLFTSGSTGRPKGVTVDHRAILNRLDWMAAAYDVDHRDVVIHKTPNTFDVSVWELFLPALTGATMVLAEAGRHGDPRHVADMVRRHRATVMHFVPSMLSAFIDVLGEDIAELTSLRAVFTSGEALAGATAHSLLRLLPGVAVHNLYGPTEAAVDVTAHEVTPKEQTVPIGSPVWNTTAHVLDARLRPLPPGLPGELYLGGIQVARGYAARPDLTAERFVADPLGVPGSRLYRTGDLVRWNTRGEIDYLGRTDFQVKLRGQRLELGEIEAVIAAVPGVVHTAATVVENAGEQQLVAYLAPESVDLEAVAAAVRNALPAYMRPSLWVPLERVVLNSAGKLDRRALPRPDELAPEQTMVAPATADEARVAAVFAEILGVDEIGVTTGFFDLGGNSLSATRLAARVGLAMDVEISVRDIFDAPSVRELVQLISGRSAGLPPVTAVTPRPEMVPLSFAQQRIWFINRFDPGTAMHNIPAVLRLSGDLDAAALHAAVVDVVTRHEVLHTRFPDVDGVPAQQIDPADSVADRLDWQVVDSQERVAAAVTAGFDVTVDWPIRVRLWPVSATEHILAIVFHHIGADGESLAPFVSDLVTAYVARSAHTEPDFAPLQVQFADFALWQHTVLGSTDDPESVVGRQLAYWADQLAGLPDVLELPADRTRPAVASGRGGHVAHPMPAELGSAISAAAQRHGVTPFMVVHAALAVLLSRLSGTDDIAVGTPIAGRGQAVLDPLVGMFVNTLVLRTRIDPAQGFDDLLATVRTTDLDAFAHADIPFETLVDELNPVRSEAFSPLTQVIFSFDPAASAIDALGDAGGLTVTAVDDVSVAAQTDLYVTVASRPDGQEWGLSVTYATDLFDESRIDALAARFIALLQQLCTTPSVAVGDASLLDPAQTARIADGEWGARVDLPAPATVPDALAAQVNRTPAARALVFGEREVTYAEFGARVNTLARELIATGVGPDVAVGLCIPRSVEMMVAIHAVVTAGGQYVPIDVNAPAERVRYMLDTAGAAALLVADTGAAAAAVGAAVDAGVRILRVDSSTAVDVNSAAAQPVTDADRPTVLLGDAAAYTLFTSGSTGRPKGVTLSHTAVLNRLWWGLDTLPIDAGDVVLQKTPYTFDCSVPELFAPLMTGATLVVLADGGHLDPGYVADEIRRTRATMVHFVPSMLSVFLEILGSGPHRKERLAGLDSVRIVSATGEALPPAVAAQARALWPEALFFNLYGPTEAAVEITYEQIGDVAADDPTVPIGVPVWNSSAVVLDSRLHRVPDGVPGELYLGGVQLARGYAARPDLSAERFVADPYGAPGARLYRTGDLVRRRPDGVLEYLGRTDFQVKLRGQRIELGEIESVIASAPGVVHAAATVASVPGGGEHLVGYVSAAPGETVDLDAVRAVVAESLPEYMRPTVWMPVADIALNTAGKIDRRALPEPVFEAGDYVAPVGEAETRVAEVFADILGVEQISVTDSFFDLGGNSLSAMRLAARAADALGTDVGVRDLFDAPSVRALVAATAGNGDTRPPITAVSPRPERIPLAFAQQRMWYVNQLDTTSAAYNIPIVLRLTGPLDVDALHAAVVDVVTRHEVLRTTFPAESGVPYQKIGRASAVAAKLDWAQVDSVADVQAAVAEGFDVATQWPIRVRVARIGIDEHVLAVVTHHIASDGESVAPLVSDLVTAYLAETADTDPQFADLEVQFADVALWQHDVLGSPDDPESVVGQQIAYWRDKLSGLSDVLDIPTDRPRPPRASGRGARVPFTLPAATGDKVRAAAAEYGTTPFMVVHAGLSLLLSRLAGSDDIAIGTPIAGRGQAVLDPLVGMFVNTLVLRTRVDADHGFADLLAAIKDTDLEAFAHADAPFEAVVDASDAVRSEAFAPFTQVWFTFDQTALPELAGADLSIGEIAGLRVEPIATDVVPARVDLLVSVSPTAGDTAGSDWPGSVLYATDLFDESTVSAFTGRLVDVLD